MKKDFDEWNSEKKKVEESQSNNLQKFENRLSPVFHWVAPTCMYSIYRSQNLSTTKIKRAPKALTPFGSLFV